MLTYIRHYYLFLREMAWKHIACYTNKSGSGHMLVGYQGFGIGKKTFAKRNNKTFYFLWITAYTRNIFRNALKNLLEHLSVLFNIYTF